MSILPRLCDDKEILYQRKQFQETLDVHGYKAKLYPVKRRDYEDIYDFYNDVREHDIAYNDPIDIRILFEEVPQRRTLKSFGWYVEDDNLPYLAYIPTVYLDLESKENLLIPSVDDKIVLVDETIDTIRSTRSYAIKDMKSLGYPNTIYHIAKLVPVRENKDSQMDKEIIY